MIRERASRGFFLDYTRLRFAAEKPADV